MESVTNGCTTTLAVADKVLSVLLVAVTVTVVFADTFGAVNTPLLEITPLVADQVTPVFEVPVMLAVNCCVACEASVA